MSLLHSFVLGEASILPNAIALAYFAGTGEMPSRGAVDLQRLPPEPAILERTAAIAPCWMGLRLSRPRYAFLVIRAETGCIVGRHSVVIYIKQCSE